MQELSWDCYWILSEMLLDIIRGVARYCPGSYSMLLSFNVYTSECKYWLGF